jgi:hypothetical protein
MALVLIYMALTTVGWAQILNSQSSRRLQAYFVLTLNLVTVFNLAVASVSGEGTSNGLIILVPVLQSAVLTPLSSA